MRKQNSYNFTGLQRVWVSDQAHFPLTGQVNTQNCRVWASNAPDIVLETPPHSSRVTVWCAMSPTGIIGPFFKDADGHTQTVNKERYVDILKRF